MKHPFNSRILPWFSLGMGGLAFALRSWLYGNGVDEKGLFLPSHPAIVLSFVLTALFLGLLALCALSASKTATYKKMFPKSILRAAGSVAGGIGTLLTAISLLTNSTGNTVALFAGIVGIPAAIALGLCGWCRWLGKKPNFYFHGIVTVFFLLLCICRYRSWGSEPQLNIYFFQMLACILLMLAGFQCAAMDAGMGNVRILTFFTQAALFFCLATIPDGNGIFFLGAALWCASATPSDSPKNGR